MGWGVTFLLEALLGEGWGRYSGPPSSCDVADEEISENGRLGDGARAETPDSIDGAARRFVVVDCREDADGGGLTAKSSLLASRSGTRSFAFSVDSSALTPLSLRDDCALLMASSRM